MPLKSKRKLLKIGELAKRTGVQKETIHFYINQGLLPRPFKTSRNMAYYDERYIGRIRLIKELQLKRFLPLKVIREIISEDTGALSPSELNVIRLGGGPLAELEKLRHEFEPLSLAALSERSGLPEDEILDMERCEMISSEENEQGEKVYGDNDIRIVEAFAEVRRGGLTREVGFATEDFRLQSDIVSMLAIEEVKVFGRKFANRYSDEDADLLPKIAENAIESINAFISHLRRKKILEAIRAFSEGGEDALNDVGEQRHNGRKGTP
jgi:DNA-binding transcriptional MerR regulator